MNKRQKTVVLVGLALMVLMGLVPPWIHSFDYRSDKFFWKFERFAGYSLLFNPPEPGWEGQNILEFFKNIARSSDRLFWNRWEEEQKHILDYNIFSGKPYWTPRIDIVRLLIQWALIIFVISGIFIFLKDEKA